MNITARTVKHLALVAVSLPLALASAPALAVTIVFCSDLNPGLCQAFPVLPGAVNGPVWTFTNPQSGLWFDPPTAISFEIEVMGAGAVVTRIGAPTGFQNLVIKVADTPVDSDFDGGDFHRFAPAVTKFNISGFSVDAGNTSAFPLYMEFGGSVTSMTWTAELAPVPEPGTYALMVLGLAGVLAAARRR